MNRLLPCFFRQHSQLLNRLEGGGEYTALVVDHSKQSYWSDSVKQVSDIVQFVAHESGIISTDDSLDDDEQQHGNNSEDEIPHHNPQLKPILSNHGYEDEGSIIPYDLSVNHLKLIENAPGRPPTPPLPLYSSAATITEDFLPVVTQSDLVFRWRHHPKSGSLTSSATKVTAYQILVRRMNDDMYLLWDSGKVTANPTEEAITSVKYGAKSLPRVGEILQWRVILWDNENEREIILLTNHLKFGATTIADIYKERWQIELFFKALKQNLKIKSFVGTSENALRIQIWTALIAMLLLKWLHHLSRASWSFSNLASLLRLNLFTYRHLRDWLNAPYNTPPHIPPEEQLQLPLAGLGQAT